MTPAGRSPGSRVVDLAVIGAGPAGCAAAVQAVRMGMSVALLDRTGRAGGLVRNAYCIENWPGLEVPASGPEMVRRLEASLERFGIAVRRAAVERVAATRGGFVLTGKMGRGRARLTARSVIVATGTVPREWDDAPEGMRVHTEVADALAVHPKTALVVGGGEAALDYALSLAAAGAAVEVWVRGQAPRAAKRLIDMVRACKSIRIRTGVGAETWGKSFAARQGGTAEFEEGCACALRMTVPSMDSRWDGMTVPGKDSRWDGMTVPSMDSFDVVVAAIGRRPALPELPPAAPEALSGRDRRGGERGGPTPVAAPPAAPEAEPVPAAAFSVLTVAPGLYIAGDARRGRLGQAAIAVGDGVEAAMLAWERIRTCSK